MHRVKLVDASVFAVKVHNAIYKTRLIYEVISPAETTSVSASHDGNAKFTQQSQAYANKLYDFASW